MPYYHVLINHNRNSEFVVNAPNRETAEDIALLAEDSGKCDNKKIVPLRVDNSSSITVSDADKTAWLDTLKKQKAK